MFPPASAFHPSPSFLATEYNWEPFIASVLVAEISPGAICFNWRSLPSLPKETILPSSTLVAPAKFPYLIVVPSVSVTSASVTFLPWIPTVVDPPPIATALACGVWAPVPIATEFIPLASDKVPIARAISPASAFTPKATAPWPLLVPLYTLYPKPSVLPVKFLYISFKLWLFTFWVLIWVPFLSKIFFV